MRSGFEIGIANLTPMTAGSHLPPEILRCRLHPGMDLQLLINARDVIAHRVDADVQSVADLLVGKTLADVVKNFAFTVCEPVEFAG